MSAQWTYDRIVNDLIGLIKEMTRDFECDFGDGITEDTHLGNDLAFESIDMVELFVEIEGHFKRRDLRIQRLIGDRERYYDVDVKTIARFLHEELGSAEVP